jgi:hypothetical protein
VSPKQRQAEQLPGFEKAIDLSSRNAFGRVPKSEYFGIDPHEFDDVSDKDRAYADVEYCFTRRLYGGTSGLVVDGLALNPGEYEAIVRSPSAFAVAIAARTTNARILDGNIQRREEAVSRSVGHAITSKRERAVLVIKGLEAEQAALQKLLKEMKSPGYAHMSEADMRILAETARTSFDNLLDVVGRQAGWSPEQRKRAERAMNARLFDSDYRQSFAYWKKLTTVAERYVGQKINLFKRKSKHASRTAER